MRTALLLTVLGLIVCSGSAQSNKASFPVPASAVGSPNQRYCAYWVDLPTQLGFQARRIIFVVDTVSNEILFMHSSLERWTGAVWNEHSNACAIFDAPDNANVFLWIIRKDFANPDGKWTTREIPVEKLALEKRPPVSEGENVRVGIEKVAWKSDERLLVDLTIRGDRLELEVPQ